MRYRFAAALAAALALVLSLFTLLPGGSPLAAAHQPSTAAPTAGLMPNTVPAAFTPAVDNGSVQSIAQVGNLIVIGGDFTSVGGQTRNRIAAFDATTGALSSAFAPSLDNTVYSVIPGPTTGTVFAGGLFTTVNGTAQKFLTELNVSTGAIVTTFTVPAVNFGQINDLVLRGNRLYLAGTFTKVGGVAHGGLAALNATTGKVDPFLNIQLAGHHNTTANGARGPVGPIAFDVTQDGTRMVVVGNFTTADGLPRDQLAVVTLDGSSAQVDPNWATTRYAPQCFYWAFDTYMRGVTFSPDGSYFVVDATGGGNPGTLCDATVRFETRASGADLQPTWIDETGGDTVWATAVTDTAIFVGGHNRWENNPLGVDNPRAGAVPRAGLEAFDPISGRPLAWNPGRVPLGTAVFAMLATPQGLWIGSDTQWVGNYRYKRPRLAFFPYTGGKPVASTAVGRLPGNVFLGESTSGPTNVLYRVDAGGPALKSTDGGPNWAADTSDPSPYRNTGSNTAGYSSGATADSTVPASTPNAIFNSERWDPGDGPQNEMQWHFPVAAGTPVEVRLYLVNRYSGTSQPGQRVFDVDVNGQRFLDHEDLVADVGDQVGTMKKLDLTVPASGSIDIQWDHEVENPLVNGIEIVRTDVAPPTQGDSLQRIGFTGTTARAPKSVPTGGVPWGSAHAAFMVGNQVFYGGNDGYLYSVTFDGTTWGTPTKLDPYHDPAWQNVKTGDGDTTFGGVLPDFYAQIPNLTGMVYSGGRVYYTLFGDSQLHSAWFSPDSGIIDQTTSTQPSTVDFSDADGLFVDGSTLYYATADGTLHSVPFGAGAVTGTSSPVSGPALDGVSWSNTAMFLFQGTIPNDPPAAAFTSSCTAGACSFDGTGSSDGDGTVASYSWNFGDGTTGVGPTPSHTYVTSGTFSVTLTVTDNGGANGSVTHPVSVTVPVTSHVSYVGAGDSEPASAKVKSATVPAGAAAGDTALVFFTQASTSTWTGPTGLSGLTRVNAFNDGTLTTTVWAKTLTAADLGATVQETSTTVAGAVLTVAVYRGLDAATPVAASAAKSDANSTSHPSATITAPSGDWALTYWSDKSAATTAWSTPASVTRRDATYGTGAGRYSATVTDTNGPVPGGSYGGLVATTDAQSNRALSWTIALQPAP